MQLVELPTLKAGFARPERLIMAVGQQLVLGQRQLVTLEQAVLVKEVLLEQ